MAQAPVQVPDGLAGGKAGIPSVDVLMPDGRVRPYPPVRPQAAPQTPAERPWLGQLIDVLQRQMVGERPLGGVLPVMANQALLPGVRAQAEAQGRLTSTEQGVEELNRWLREQARPVVDWSREKVAQPLAGAIAYQAMQTDPAVLGAMAQADPGVAELGAYTARLLAGQPMVQAPEVPEELLVQAGINPARERRDLGEVWRGMGRFERQLPWWWRMPAEMALDPINWLGWVGGGLSNTGQVVDATGRTIGSASAMGLPSGAAGATMGLPSGAAAAQGLNLGPALRGLGRAATAQNVGRAMRAVDTAQNVSTWLTANEDELPAMIAFAAVARFGGLLWHQTQGLARWYKGETYPPSARALATALQAEWELGYREAGQTPPQTLKVSTQDGQVTELPASKAFRQAGKMLHSWMRQGFVPDPSTLTGRAVAGMQTPQARVQMGLAALLKRAGDWGEDYLRRSSESMRAEGETLDWSEWQATWGAARAAEEAAATRASWSPLARSAPEPDTERLARWTEHTQRMQGELTPEQAQAGMAYARGESMDAPWGRWPEAQAGRAAGFDETTATQWLRNMLDTQGELTVEQAEAVTAYQFGDGPPPWERWPEGLEVQPQRATIKGEGSAAEYRQGQALTSAPDAAYHTTRTARDYAHGGQRDLAQGLLAGQGSEQFTYDAQELYRQVTGERPRGPRLATQWAGLRDPGVDYSHSAAPAATAAEIPLADEPGRRTKPWQFTLDEVVSAVAQAEVDPEAPLPQMLAYQRWTQMLESGERLEPAGDDGQERVAVYAVRADAPHEALWPGQEVSLEPLANEPAVAVVAPSDLRRYRVTPAAQPAIYYVPEEIRDLGAWYQHQVDDAARRGEAVPREVLAQWPERVAPRTLQARPGAAPTPEHPYGAQARGQLITGASGGVYLWADPAEGAVERLARAMTYGERQQPVRTLAQRPYLPGLAAAIRDVHDMLASAYAAAKPAAPSRLSGLTVSHSYYGMNVPRRDGGPRGVLVNPWALLGREDVWQTVQAYLSAPRVNKGLLQSATARLGKALFGTVAHEVAHNLAQGDEEALVRALQDLPEAVGLDVWTGALERMYAAIDALLRRRDDVRALAADVEGLGLRHTLPAETYRPTPWHELMKRRAQGEAVPSWIDPTGRVMYQELGAPSGVDEMALPEPGRERGSGDERELARARGSTEGDLLGDDEGVRPEHSAPAEALRPGAGGEGAGDAGRSGADAPGGTAAGGEPTGGDGPVAEALPGGSLVALHNLSEESLIEAARLGGMPVPSIAITRWDMPHRGFGGITLIGTRRMIDPQADPRHRVYDADIWSPTRPAEVWRKPLLKRANAAIARLLAADPRQRHSGTSSDVYQIFEALYNFPDRNRALDRLLNGEGLGRLAFLHERGVEIAPVRVSYTPSQAVAGDAQLLAWYREHEAELAVLRRQAGSEAGLRHPLQGALYEQVRAAWQRQMRAEGVTRPSLYEDIFERDYRDPATGWLSFRRADRLLEELGRVARDETVEDWHATRKLIDEAVARHGGDDALHAWAREVVNIFEPPRLRLRGKLVPYTLENIVDAMTLHRHGADVTKGGPLGTFGTGQARAVAARPLGSVAEMHAAEGRLAPREDVEDYDTTRYQPALAAYQKAVEPFSTHGSGGGSLSALIDAGFDRLNGTLRAIGDYLKGTRGERNPQRMRQALARHGFAGVDEAALSLALDAAEALRDRPVGLFEAKPQRAVGIEEFAGAVIPSNTGQQARDVLRRNRVPMVEYTPGDEASRRRAIERLSSRPGAMFAKTTVEQTPSGDWKHGQQLLLPESGLPSHPDAYYHPQVGPHIKLDNHEGLQSQIVDDESLSPLLREQIDAARRVASGTYSDADAALMSRGSEAWWNDFAPDDPAKRAAWVEERRKYPWGDLWNDTIDVAHGYDLTDLATIERYVAGKFLRRARVFGYLQAPDRLGGDVAPYTGRMIAVHNVDQWKLARALALGGMPMPSLAVTREDQVFEQFGEIGFVARRSVIDPETSMVNQVFSADAWTPTAPQERGGRGTPELADGVCERLRRALDPLGLLGVDRLGQELNDLHNAISWGISRNEALAHFDTTGLGKLAFLVERGLQPPYQLRHVSVAEKLVAIGNDERVVDWGRTMPALSQELRTLGLVREYEAWVQELLKDWPKPYLQHKDQKLDLNLENILTVMLAEPPQIELDDAQTLSALRGALSQRFASLEEMRAEAGRLVDQADDHGRLGDIRWHLRQFDEAVEKCLARQHRSMPGGSSGLAFNVMRRYLRTSTGPSLTALREAFAYCRLDMDDVRHALLEEILPVFEEFRRLPDAFLEAKPQRVIGFDEWAGALVPEGASVELEERLRAAGVAKIVRYGYLQSNGRAVALKKLLAEEPDAAFERTGAGGAGVEQTDQRAQRKEARYIMATPQMMLSGIADGEVYGDTAASVSRQATLQSTIRYMRLLRGMPEHGERFGAYRALLWAAEQEYLDSERPLTELYDVAQLPATTWTAEEQIWAVPEGFDVVTRYDALVGDAYELNATVRDWLRYGEMPRWYQTLSREDRLRLALRLAGVQPIAPRADAEMPTLQRDGLQGLWQRAQSSVDWWLLEAAKALEAYERGPGLEDTLQERARQYSKLMDGLEPTQRLQVAMYMASGIPPLKLGIHEPETPAWHTPPRPDYVDLLELVERLETIDRLLDETGPGPAGGTALAVKAEVAQLPWNIGELGMASANPELWRLARYAWPAFRSTRQMLVNLLPRRVSERLEAAHGMAPTALGLRIRRHIDADTPMLWDRTKHASAMLRLLTMQAPEVELEPWIAQAPEVGLKWLVTLLKLDMPDTGTSVRAHEARLRLLKLFSEWATERDKEDLLVVMFGGMVYEGDASRIEIEGVVPVPKDVADKAEAVRQRAQERLAQARPPQEMRRAAPEGVHTDAQVGYVEGYEQVDALQRYTGYMDQIMVRELLQNMVDASRGLGQRQVTLQLWSDERLLVAKDHGRGMTPEQVVNEFVKIGATDKPEGASGGKGSAKTALLGNADVVFVRTVAYDPATGRMMDTIIWGTGEEYLNKGAGLTRASFEAGQMPREVLDQMPAMIADDSHWRNADGTWRTGTVQVEMARPDAHWGGSQKQRSWLLAFVNAQRLQDIEVTFEVNDRPVRNELPTDWVQVETVAEGPVDMVIYRSKRQGTRREVPVTVLNNGLPQYEDTLYLGDMMDAPDALVVDVISHVSAQDRRDPWTADRRALHSVYEYRWKDHVTAGLRQSYQDRERVRLQALLYDESPVIVTGERGHELRLVSEKDLPSETLREVAGRAYVRSWAQAVDRAHRLLIELLATESLGWASVQGLSEPLGLGLSDEWHGVNIKPDMLGGSRHRILINPWSFVDELDSRGARLIDEALSETDPARVAERIDAAIEALAERMLDTLYHELVHDRYWDHGDQFSGRVGALSSTIGTRARLALEQGIIALLRQGLANQSDLAQFAADGRLAAQAPSKAGGVGRYGSQESIERPDGEAGDVEPDGDRGGERGEELLPGVSDAVESGGAVQPGGGEAGLRRLPGGHGDPAAGESAALARGRESPADPASGGGLAGEAAGPRAVAGHETWSYGTEANQRLTHRLKVVELDDLVVSHDLGGQENPRYPQELQPRDRTRTGSVEWVQGVAPQLDPDRLLFDGHRLDDGPPIVNAQNQVESGNGRALAIELAQRDFPRRYEAYREALMAYAAQYGLDSAAIADMTTPVLVRERVTPIADVVAYVDAANKPQIQQRSEAEQARADARLIDDDMLADLKVEGETDIREALKQEQNKQIVYDFIKALAPEERNAMTTATGDLSPDGYRRFMNALYTRTFRGKPGQALVGLLLESQEPGMKLIEKALMGSLGPMAKAEGLMQEGARDVTLSLANALARTLVHLQELRHSKTPVDVYLNTRAIFVGGGDLNDFEKWLLELVSRLVKSPTRLRDLLVRYAELVVASPDPRQGGLLGPVEIPPKEKLLERAIVDVATERDEDPADWMQSEIPPDPGVLGFLGEDADVRADVYPLNKGRWAHNHNWNAHVTMTEGKLVFGQMVMWGEREIFNSGAELDAEVWEQAGDVMARERLLRETLPTHMRAKAPVYAQLGSDLAEGVEVNVGVDLFGRPAAPAEAPEPSLEAPEAPAEEPVTPPVEPGPAEAAPRPTPSPTRRVKPKAKPRPQAAARDTGQVKATSPDGSLGAVVEKGHLLIGHLVRRNGRQVLRPEVRVSLADWHDLADRRARERMVREQIGSPYKARTASYVDVAEKAVEELINPKVKPSATVQGLRLVGDRTAWRVETGYRHDPETRAADVLKFERDEHGNKLADMGVDDAIMRDLVGYPASDVVWVTFSRENAMRYVDMYGQTLDGADLPEEFELGVGARLLASDGEGGYLVLLDRTATAATEPKPSDALTAEERALLGKASYRPELLELLKADELETILRSVQTDGELPMDLDPQALRTRFIRQSVEGGRERSGMRAPRTQQPGKLPPTMDELPPDATPSGLEATRQIYYPRDKFKGRGRRSIGKQVHYAGMDITVNRAMLDALAQRGYTDQQIESMWPEDVAFIYTNDISPLRSAELARYTGESVVRYKDGPVDDLDRLADAISDGRPEKGEPPDDWWMRFRVAWTDRVAPLEWLGQQVGSEVYEMARLVPGMAMRGESLIEQYVLPVLRDLTPEDLTDLESYMAIFRMIDLRSLDPDYTLPAAISDPRRAAAQLIQEIGGDEGMGHPRMRKIALAAHRLWEINQQVLLRRAREGGRISDEAVQVLISKHPHYLPFFREGMPADLDVFGSFTSAQVANLDESFIKYLTETGSDKPLESPLARWMTMLIKNEVDIARNETAREMIRALEQLQEAMGQQLVFRGDTPTADSGRVVWWEDGERQVAWVSMLYANVAKALDKEPANVLTALFTPLANVLRLGATQLNLPFTVANAIRDLMTAWYNEGLQPFGEAYWQGWLAALTHNQTWHEAAQAGALGSGIGDTFRNLRDIDRRNRQLTLGVSVRNWQEARAIVPKTWALARHMAGLAREAVRHGAAGQRDTAQDVMRRFWQDAKLLVGAGPNLILSLNEVVETATRVGGYLHLKRKGLKEREMLLRAREITIDFAKAGTAMQMINRVVPFTNAQEQAAIKTAQVLKRDPLRALLASIPFVATSLLLFYYNKRYESSKDIPDYEYLHNWLVIVDEVELPPDPEYPNEPSRVVPIYIRVPKGPIGAAFTAVPEAILRIAGQYNDRTALENLARAAKAMAEAVSPVELNATLANPLPLFGSMAEVLANRNLFTGREIVPEYEQTGRPPEERYGPDTSTAVVGLVTSFNQALESLGLEGISPRQVDYLIRANTSGMGEQALWLMDLVAQAAGYRPEMPGAAYQREPTTWEKWATNPFSKRFVGMRSNERERIEWEDVRARVPQIQRAYYRNAEVKRLGIGVTIPEGTLTLDGEEHRLTATQRRRIMERTAELAIPAQREMVRTDTYQRMSDAEREEALRGIKSRLQAHAREEVAAEITGETLDARWRPSQMRELVQAWEDYQGYVALDPSAAPLTAEQEGLVAEAQAAHDRIRRENPRLTEAQAWIAYMQHGGDAEAMQLVRRQARARNPERERYLWEHPLIQKYGWAR